MTTGSALVALALFSGALSAGCAGKPQGARATPAASPSSPSQTVPVSAPLGAAPAADPAQREAQLAWCNYLDALHKRASTGAARWAKFDECTQVTTTAAPAMLKRAAECSLTALQRFQGDPFTEAYAAEVSRCGSDAIDAMAVPAAECTPYVTVICQRAVACKEMSFDQCRAAVDEGVGPVLGRTIGAINAPSRARLRACFQSAACEDLGSQISSCITPIVDELLWLPK